MLKLNSVEILREIQESVGEPKYYHDLDVEEGKDRVVGKVISLRGAYILKESEIEPNTREEVKVLTKLQVSLQKEEVGIRYGAREYEHLMGLSRKGEFRGIMELIAHTSGTYYSGKKVELSPEGIEYWKQVLEREIGNRIGMEDVSEDLLVIYLDDGLNEFRGYIRKEQLQARGIQIGDICEVCVSKNSFTYENGYLTVEDEKDMVRISVIMKHVKKDNYFMKNE